MAGKQHQHLFDQDKLEPGDFGGFTDEPKILHDDVEPITEVLPLKEATHDKVASEARIDDSMLDESDPKIDEPKSDDHKADAPKSPKADDQKSDAPKADDQKADEPQKSDDQKAHENLTNEPKRAKMDLGKNFLFEILKISRRDRYG